MRTDFAIERLCNVAPYFADIADKLHGDEEFRSFIKNYKQNKTNNVSVALRFLPKILGVCKTEVYEVLAILEDKTVEEIKAQSIVTTINSIKTLIADEYLKSFFTFFGGNKQEDTEAEELSQSSQAHDPIPEEPVGTAEPDPTPVTADVYPSGLY